MTDQSSEVLMVGNETLYMAQVKPLENYPNGEITARAYWNLSPVSTSEHRGYHGIWTLKNNALYLTSLDGYRKKVKGFWFWRKVSYEEVMISDLFPHATNNEIKATWFTGRFSAFTKTTSNPIDDRLDVIFEKGNLVSYQWFHLEGNGKKTATSYDKPLP